jgi:D-alanyl-lipoteichoic acid acyltransferase DltB (MBOAT superfamily)
MLFNSFEFIFLFLPAVIIIYFFLNKISDRLAKVTLILSSVFFYGYYNYKYVILLSVSILVNFVIAKSLIGKKNKYILILSILFNILLLGYFKYRDFFFQSVNSVFGTDFPLLNIALPLAISFYTLQQVAFLVDSYEGVVKKVSIIDYLLFVLFFPQLVAGPIIHFYHTIPQFYDDTNKKFSPNNFLSGITLFFIGLFKKVVIADQLGIFVDKYFDSSTALSFADSWLSSIGFTLQIYFDFSGYTDMALGLGMMFNIRLPQNFKFPYLATSIIDFWKRWHITLTEFLTDYIYMAIAKSVKRFTFTKAMLATLLTFFVSGLWHGASWMFVIFGLLHGAGIVVNHLFRRLKIKLNSFLSWLITFNFINITFIFFRAHDLHKAGDFLKSMFSIDSFINYLPGFLAGLKAATSSFASDMFMFLYTHDIVTFTVYLMAVILVFFQKHLFRDFTDIDKTNNKFIHGFILGIIIFITLKTMLDAPSREFVYFVF